MEKNDLIQTLSADLRPLPLLNARRMAILWTGIGFFALMGVAFLTSRQDEAPALAIGTLIWVLISYLTFQVGKGATYFSELSLVALLFFSFGLIWFIPNTKSETSSFEGLSIVILSSIVWNLVYLFQIVKLQPSHLSKVTLYTLSSSLLFGHLVAWMAFGRSLFRVDSLFYILSVALYFGLLFPLYRQKLKELCLKQLLKTTRLFDSVKKRLFPLRLLEDEAAPTLDFIDWRGEKISSDGLRSSRKKSWVLFYRYAGCPLCRWHLSQLVSKVQTYSGIEIFIVYESSSKEVAILASQFDVPQVHWIPDPDRRFYKAYGVEKNWSAVFHWQPFLTFVRAIFSGHSQGKITGSLERIPAHFLIDEKGLIQRAYYGESIADQIPWIEVDAFVSDYGRKAFLKVV